MAKTYFNRYVWLIDTIRRFGPIKLEEINRKWLNSSLNEDGSRFADRTFFNHKNAILDSFGIEIQNDRTLGYYIEDADSISGTGLRNWMFESMSINNLINESQGMRDRILLESVPSSKKWLTEIVSAMKEGRALHIKYRSFYNSHESEFDAHPWCLKLFNQRWYMLAKTPVHPEKPRIYSLDRILDLKPTTTRLQIPSGFNAADFFANYFGIVVGDGSEVCQIDLKVDAHQAKYFKSLPLHSSQRIIKETPDYVIFRFRLAPTYDFCQTILSHGSRVEVLSPQSFRDEVAGELRAALEAYTVTP